jgi:hypothetical protein
MKTFFIKRPAPTLMAVLLGLAFAGQTQAAAVLNPLFTLAAKPATLSAGGLAATWYKIQNDAKFSEGQFNGETIKNTGWGTGIWDIRDIAGIVADPRPGYVIDSTTSVGAVNYANNIYNNTITNTKIYGNWSADYSRPLAPIVDVKNGCLAEPVEALTRGCANEVNYAAVFTGYLQVITDGVYDFGVFADDIFSFSLTGLNNSFGLTKSAVAGNPGRTFETLNGFNLSEGFYGIGLNYANRLEAGVINLVWSKGGEEKWDTIGGSNLYNQVPEPGTLALTFLGLIGLWGARKQTVNSNPTSPA